MYNSIYELPSQVLASLDKNDAAKWMEAYNSLSPTTEKEVKNAKKEAWKACRNLPSSFSFKIKASVDAIDKDREIIDLDSIKKHMDSYMDYGGNIQYEHGGYHVGCCWDWEPFTKDGMKGIYVWGNLFGGDQVYDDMREHFVKGRNSLSVAGEADKGKYQCDERGCYVRRDVKQLLEISLCTVPANKYCRMEWYNDKANFTKSSSVASDLRFQVDEYEIHKTYKECPHLALKKSLMDAGYDAHAREDGVHIIMSAEDADRQYWVFRKAGFCAVPDETGIMIQSKEELVKNTFTQLFQKSAISPDGTIGDIEPDMFHMLLTNGLIVRENGHYVLSRD
jgi:hypothetical protein